MFMKKIYLTLWDGWKEEIKKLLLTTSSFFLLLIPTVPVIGMGENNSRFDKKGLNQVNK